MTRRDEARRILASWMRWMNVGTVTNQTGCPRWITRSWSTRYSTRGESDDDDTAGHADRRGGDYLERTGAGACAAGRGPAQGAGSAHSTAVAGALQRPPGLESVDSAAGEHRVNPATHRPRHSTATTNEDNCF